MTDLEKVRQWLLGYPAWEEGKLLYIDYTDAVPGNAGLYPNGLEEVSRKTDVLGNVTVQNRYHFALYRVVDGQEDNTENAAWLMAFQKWVQSQSAAGLAPQFGDEPARERIRAEKGKLKEASQTGTGTYVVTLTAEFTNYYGGNENE